MAGPTRSVAALVERLALEEHPEGGWFRRTWQHDVVEEGRPLASSIQYLLPEGVVSRWHRVDAAESWIFNGGAPLALSMTDHDGRLITVELGPPSDPGTMPQHVVPAGAWQSATSRGEYSLVTCVVVPGFVWEGFELAPDGWSPGRAPAD